MPGRKTGARGGDGIDACGRCLATENSKSAPHLGPRTPANCGQVVKFRCPTEITPAGGSILEILGGLGEILEDSIKQIEEIWRIWNRRRVQNLDFY